MRSGIKKVRYALRFNVEYARISTKRNVERVTLHTKATASRAAMVRISEHMKLCGDMHLVKWTWSHQSLRILAQSLRLALLVFQWPCLHSFPEEPMHHSPDLQNKTTNKNSRGKNICIFSLIKQIERWWDQMQPWESNHESASVGVMLPCEDL